MIPVYRVEHQTEPEGNLPVNEGPFMSLGDDVFKGFNRYGNRKPNPRNDTPVQLSTKAHIPDDWVCGCQSVEQLKSWFIWDIDVLGDFEVKVYEVPNDAVNIFAHQVTFDPAVATLRLILPISIVKGDS